MHDYDELNDKVVSLIKILYTQLEKNFENNEENNFMIDVSGYDTDIIQSFLELSFGNYVNLSSSINFAFDLTRDGRYIIVRYENDVVAMWDDMLRQHYVK